MVQGIKKLGKPNKNKVQKLARQAKHPPQPKLGQTLKLPKNKFLNEALDDRALSKAIDKANEKKVAAKVLQGGGKIAMNDIRVSGKELNKDIRRQQLKRKLTRVEEKLKVLQDKEKEL
jgi:hypothetical protein